MMPPRPSAGSGPAIAPPAGRLMPGRPRGLSAAAVFRPSGGPARPRVRRNEKKAPGIKPGSTTLLPRARGHNSPTK